MTYRLIGLVVAVFIIGVPAYSQELIVRGRFLSDTIKIGEEAAYTLGASYPDNLNVLFPDSTINTFPFEYKRRAYFQTKTRNGISTDSVVYYYSTFETDSLQYLSLPVYVVHPTDCTEVYAARDSLYLKRMLGAIPDSVKLHDLPLKETVAYENIPTSFVTVLYTLIGGTLLLIAAGVYAVFGKRIRRHYRLIRLQRNYSKFTENYNANLARMRQEATSEVAESTVGMWKKYLENLEYQPYTKLTTKETIRLLKDDTIKSNLQHIDRSIYGRQPVQVQAFEGLMNFAEHKYRQKLEEVLHE